MGSSRAPVFGLVGGVGCVWGVKEQLPHMPAMGSSCACDWWFDKGFVKRGVFLESPRSGCCMGVTERAPEWTACSASRGCACVPAQTHHTPQQSRHHMPRGHRRAVARDWRLPETNPGVEGGCPKRKPGGRLVAENKRQPKTKGRPTAKVAVGVPNNTPRRAPRLRAP